MTSMEAWSNVSKRLAELDKKDGYTHEALEAEAISFQALKEMEDKHGHSKGNRDAGCTGSAGRGGEEPMYLKVAPITFRDASDFINAHHRHHAASQGCKFCVSLRDRSGEVQGVAVCGRPVSRKLDDGYTLEINRVCTLGQQNACSMLYGACCRIAKDMGYSKVITYTLETEPGTSLRVSNFHNDGRAGGTHWTGERNRGQKIPAEMKIRWTREVV